VTDDAAQPTSAGPGRTRLRRWLAIGALLSFALAAVTGTWLWFGYYPMPPGTDPADLIPAAAETARMQDWHVTSSALATVLGGLWVALTLSRVLATPGRDRGPGGLLLALGAAIVLLLGSVVAWITGPMLAWQQIGLWAVTVGTEVGGLEVGNDQVRFYLVEGRQVSSGDFRTTALLHALGMPLALVAAGAGLAVAARGRRKADGPGAPGGDALSRR
jgi:quinol-cytochrome oxidoreductase complex cytochrome b subunit